MKRLTDIPLTGFQRKKLSNPPHRYGKYALFKGGDLEKDIKNIKERLPPMDFSEGFNERHILKAFIKSLSKFTTDLLSPKSIDKKFSLDSVFPLKDASSVLDFLKINEPIIQRREAMTNAQRVQLTLIIFRNLVAYENECKIPRAPVEAQEDVVMKVGSKDKTEKVRTQKMSMIKKDVMTTKQRPLEKNPLIKDPAVKTVLGGDLETVRKIDELNKLASEIRGHLSVIKTAPGSARKLTGNELAVKMTMPPKKMTGNKMLDAINSQSTIAKLEDRATVNNGSMLGGLTIEGPVPGLKPGMLGSTYKGGQMEKTDVSPLTSLLIQRLFATDAEIGKPAPLYMPGFSLILETVIKTFIDNDKEIDKMYKDKWTVEDVSEEIVDMVKDEIEEKDILDKAAKLILTQIEGRIGVKFSSIDAMLKENILQYYRDLLRDLVDGVYDS
jgi:hypothetical protein